MVSEIEKSKKAMSQATYGLGMGCAGHQAKHMKSIWGAPKLGDNDAQISPWAASIHSLRHPRSLRNLIKMPCRAPRRANRIFLRHLPILHRFFTSRADHLSTIWTPKPDPKSIKKRSSANLCPQRFWYDMGKAFTWLWTANGGPENSKSLLIHGRVDQKRNCN